MNAPPEARNDRTERLWAIAGLAGVVGVGLVLRLQGLRRDVWFDEAVSARLVQFPTPEMVERVAGDNHSPFYFLLLKLWSLAFGGSPAALRGLSIVAGLATILGCYLLIREGLQQAGSSARTGRLAALAGALLVAVDRHQVFWSAQIRMYSLAIALGVFTTVLLLRALKEPQSARKWMAYGALAACCVYAHYYALFFIASQGLFAAVIVIRQSAWKGPLLAAGTSVLLFSPWVPVLLKQRAQVSREWWMPPLSAEWVMKQWAAPLLDEQTEHWGLLVAGTAAVAALVFISWRGQRWQRLCAVTVLGSFVLAGVVSLFSANILMARYLLAAQTLLLACLVGALLPVRPKWLGAGLLGAAILLSGAFTGAGLVERDPAGRPDISGAARFLAAHRQESQPLIVSLHEYFPALIHMGKVPGWLYAPKGRLPHFLAASLLTDEEKLVTDADLAAMTEGVLWTLDSEPFAVTVPSWWERGPVETFPGFSVDIRLTRFIVHPPPSPK